MKKGTVIFCEYVEDQRVQYDIQTIVKIKDNFAITNDGYKINIETRTEKTKSGAYRVWDILSESNYTQFASVREIKKARKWYKHIGEFDEKILEAYNVCHPSKEDKRPFFHELSPETYRMVIIETVDYINTHFRKPTWCGHPYALNGWFGCKRLISGRQISADFCQKCSCFVQPRYPDLFKRLRLLAGLPVSKVQAFIKNPRYADIEAGNLNPTPKDIEKLMCLYAVDEWNVDDALRLLNSPDKKLDRDFIEKYRETTLKRIDNEKKKRS